MFKRRIYSNISVCGKKLKLIDDIFTYSTKSSDLNMYEVGGFLNNITEFLLSDISNKMIKIPVFEILLETKKDYVIPLIH